MFAISGDWIVRSHEHPYSEYHVIKQGDRHHARGIEKVILEPVMANMFCYKDTEGHGKQFAGYQHKDQQGRKCETHCRNVDELDIGPHCLVGLMRSPCGIPKCIWDVECSAGNGIGYRGTVNTVEIEGGKTVPCQAWNRDYPHAHSHFHPSPYNTAVYGIGHHNYCRNPDPENTHAVWCYTTSFWVRAAQCSVPHCDERFNYFK